MSEDLEPRQNQQHAPTSQLHDSIPHRKSRNNNPSRPNGSSFNHIEYHARWLRRLLGLMLGAIIVVPTAGFLLFGVSHLKALTHENANQIALLVSNRQEGGNLNLESLSARLWEEMANHEILSIRFLGAGSREILRLGEPNRSMFNLTAEAQLSSPAHSIRSVVVQADWRPLIRLTGRVLGIHLVVACCLALAVYFIPMRALRQAIAHLKTAHAQVIHADKLSGIGEVYACLAHELNSPLSILLSRVNLLIGSAGKGQSQKDLIRDLKVIRRHGTRIATIFQSLLTFARKTPFEFVQADLNQVVKETVALVEEPFARKRVEINTVLAHQLPTLSGSPNHLQQVFLNLLNNARDAMLEGGQITVRTFENNTHLVVEVQDSGTGIADDILDRIFEPFFTTKKAGKGTGLGLAVSYGIIADHGGEIKVESLPSRGSTFRVELPLGERRP